MVCIYCGGPTAVLNSRLHKKANRVWRRRQCATCQSVFTTHELIDLAASLRVQDSQGTLAPFSRDRLLISLLRSCGHRKAALADAAAITETIIMKLQARQPQALITKAAIMETAATTLHHFDRAAETHYRAYHPA